MILAELARVQEERGFVSADDARAVAARLGVPLHRVEGLLSFYPRFRRTAPPRVRIALCRDVACWLRGGEALLRAARALAGPDVGVEEVSCLGRCDGAPAAAVNDEPLAPADAERLAAIAAGREPPPAPEPPPVRREWRIARDAPDAPPFHPDAVVAALADAGLHGMGGAGFPAAEKWDLVRKADGAPKYVVCNADESEPGAFKDRVILEELPELVIEGIALAARVVEAERAIVYIRHEYDRARRALTAALARTTALPCPVEIFASPGGYVMGEETALLEALEDRRGEPRVKPPFPGTCGLHGKPTLINNVETLVAAAAIWRRGAAWWKAQGRGRGVLPQVPPGSFRGDGHSGGIRGGAGLKFVSVSGHVARPDVYEIALGTTVAELIERAGGCIPPGPGRGDTPRGRLLAFAPGGASSNFLPAEKADTPLDFRALADAGSMLGSGALVIVAEGTDLLALGANVARFFRRESCGKCVPCRVGTEKAVALLDDVLAGRRPRAELDALPDLEEAMRLTSICGLGQVALGPVLSIRRNFGV